MSNNLGGCGIEGYDSLIGLDVKHIKRPSFYGGGYMTRNRAWIIPLLVSLGLLLFSALISTTDETSPVLSWVTGAAIGVSLSLTSLAVNFTNTVSARLISITGFVAVGLAAFLYVNQL